MDNKIDIIDIKEKYMASDIMHLPSFLVSIGVKKTKQMTGWQKEKKNRLKLESNKKINDSIDDLSSSIVEYKNKGLNLLFNRIDQFSNKEDNVNTRELLEILNFLKIENKEATQIIDNNVSGSGFNIIFDNKTDGKKK